MTHRYTDEGSINRFFTLAHLSNKSNIGSIRVQEPWNDVPLPVAPKGVSYRRNLTFEVFCPNSRKIIILLINNENYNNKQR